MRIYSNTLLSRDIYEAAALVPGCTVELTEHASRTHRLSFDMKLSGDGPGVARRRGNSGQYGAMGTEDGYALMWDEWGLILADLYRRDPAMVCGSVKSPTYASADDYHWQTGARFRSTNIDLHTHRWLFVGTSAAGTYSMFDCKGTKTKHCTAFIRVQSSNGATS